MHYRISQTFERERLGLKNLTRNLDLSSMPAGEACDLTANWRLTTAEGQRLWVSDPLNRDPEIDLGYEIIFNWTSLHAHYIQRNHNRDILRERVVPLGLDYAEMIRNKVLVAGTAPSVWMRWTRESHADVMIGRAG